MKAVLLATALVLLAVLSSAQTADPRWDPFLGCWDLTADNVRNQDAADAALPAAPLASRSRLTAGPRVCVTRSIDGGARFETTLPGQLAVTDTIVADGTARPVVDDGCRGTQRAEFSADGLRIFSRAELTCDGDARPRQVSGISLLTTTGSWLDIRAVTSGGSETVRVRRYYPADSQTRGIPRATLGASNLSLEDVREAGGKVSPRALEAALVETNAGFFLSARDLIALDDAGVPGSVIDVMVALSYPDRFVIERTARGGGGGSFADDPFMLGWAFGYPVLYDSFYYSPYYYSPFGYRPYDVYSGGGVVMTPVVNEPQPSGAARAVDGLGYTRIRPREVLPPDTSDTGSRTTSSGTMPSPAPASSSSGSSSGTASSGGGYSSGGGGGGDTGRTAQPR